MRLVGSILVSLMMLMIFSPVCLAVPNEVQLTPAEKEFIEKHPEIHLGVDPRFMPFEFVDSDGEHKGIAADYIKLISERTGLKMTVDKDLSWPEAYVKAVEKQLDVLPCISKNQEREAHFLFSQPYYSFQRGIYVNESNNYIDNLDDLSDMKVAVQTNSSHHSFLEAFPSIQLSLYFSVESALQAVADGKETAFIGNLATSNYLIKANGITDLKYIKIESQEPEMLYFAVRKDWPELVGIINKGLASITEEERIAINNQWIGVEQNIDYGEIIRIASMVGGVVAIALIVSSFWIVRLRREVAAREKIQQDLRIAKDEAESANHVKSIFLARMSHEIRTPLNAIIGMAYLVKKTDVTIAQRSYLEKITQASNNMLGIINDILDFSKIEAEKIEIEKISFNLDKVLEQVINIVSIKIEEQGIEFSIDKDPMLPVYFLGDPKRIEQVLLNIINNAVKFTQEGKVSVSISLLKQEQDIYTIEFSVKDTGIGMSAEQISQVFKPFDQGDASIGRRFGGTGLGLSIARNLLELMGGEIQVNSVLNEGSTFNVQLSLEADKDKEYREKNKETSAYFRNTALEEIQETLTTDYPYHVLIVEDNKTNQFIAQSILEQAGFRVSLTDNGQDGYDFFAAHQQELDLILMDLHMPVLNGFESTALIREKDEDIPIIAMTADAITGIEEQCQSVGINYYISKPFNPEQITATILDVLKTQNRDGKNKPRDEADTPAGKPIETPIDVADGIRRLGGNKDLYYKILLEYYKENLEVPSILSKKIAEQEYKEAIQIVHKIKSSSGNIGARKLYKLASNLQKALSDENASEIEQLQQNFKQQLQQVLSQINYQ